LLDAQKYPGNYRDLIVRVAGYSAYFIDLSKSVHDDIIRRMEVAVEGFTIDLLVLILMNMVS